MQERRAQGLCYYCNEKFLPYHKCASKKFLLLTIDDEDPITSYIPDQGYFHSLSTLKTQPSPTNTDITLPLNPI